MDISVIIPTLNEERGLSHCLQNVRTAFPEAEIIVCDGGSSDQTCRIAQGGGALVCRAPRGRGVQLNAGAGMARGEILLFLHADTLLPADASYQITHFFQRPRAQIATFRMRFDHAHWLLGVYSYFTRFDSVFTSFGDQGLAVRKTFFNVLGGFPGWPLFEDVRLLQSARRKTRIYTFSCEVITSARRFQQNGFVRQQLRNGWYMLRYLCGVAPDRLALKYFGSERRPRVAEGEIFFPETAR